MVTVTSALQTIFGDEALVTGAPPRWECTTALVGRLIEGEPWLDARALEDLPDFAKTGDRYERAIRAAQR